MYPEGCIRTNNSIIILVVKSNQAIAQTLHIIIRDPRTANNYVRCSLVRTVRTEQCEQRTKNFLKSANSEQVRTANVANSANRCEQRTVRTANVANSANTEQCEQQMVRTGANSANR